MVPNQIAAILLSVLAMGAGAVGAAQVSDDVGPMPWTNDSAERDIDVSVGGNVTPDESVTLTATLHGEPVPHAPVEVNGERVGETDADGQIDITVPDADEFEVEIEPEFEGSTTVDLGDDAEDETDDGEEDEARVEVDESDDDDERSIDLAFEGNVTPNESVTVTATVNGTPLAGAVINVNGEDVGTTDASGTIQVTVPEDADEFEVEAEYDHAGKLTVEFEEEADEREDDEREFDVTVDGNVSANESVTVTATHDGTPVENAAVTVNDERVGTTNADGQLAVTLASDLGDEVEIEVETDDGEGEWEHEFEDDEDEEDDDS